MDEISRIRIEEYCEKHKSAKSKRLAKLVEMSYDLAYEITDVDAIFLEKAIQQENDTEMREALLDLDEFLTNY